MKFLVFTQTEDGALDVSDISRNAARFFGAEVVVVERKPAQRDGELDETRIAFRSRGGAFDSAFTLASRAVETADIRSARDAEARGQVPGMGALAERCKHVWELRAPDDACPQALYTLCAVLASVALGPVLPPDHGTLLGVRSARALAQSEGPAYRG